MNVSLTLAALARHLNGSLIGESNGIIQGPSSLALANRNQIAYFSNYTPLSYLQNTRAGAVILSARFCSQCPVNAIVVSNPVHSFQTAIALLQHEQTMKPAEVSAAIHPSAIISDSALLSATVSIGANTVIGKQVMIGAGVCIGANCVIEDGVCIKDNSVLGNNVSLHQRAQLGSGCTIDHGAVIGAAPFDPLKLKGHWITTKALGTVLIEDDVSIGANTVISRGALGDTCIGEGVKIDNLVQIAHDVTIGAHTAIAGCAAIGAFAHVGSHCILGGASSVAAHTCLADDVVITGMSSVNKSLTKSGIYSSGIMVSEHQRWRKNVARFKRLDDYIVRLIGLEKSRQQK